MARLFFPILAFLLLLSQASAAETDENDLFRAAEEGDVGGILISEFIILFLTLVTSCMPLRKRFSNRA